MTRGPAAIGPSPRDSGMSLIEVLVAVALFGVVGTLLLGLALSTSKVTEDTRNIANVTEESRLAMERLTRELRQAQDIVAVHLTTSLTDPTAVTFWTDFNGNGLKDLNAADPEVMTYRWNPTTNGLTLTANDPSGTAITQPVLAGAVTSFVLDLRSSMWQHDTNGDGTTTWRELDLAGAPVGNGNNLPDGPELEHVDLVRLSMTVTKSGHAQTYSTNVDLRNQD